MDHTRELGQPIPVSRTPTAHLFHRALPDELPAHSQHFGPYAIEFDIAGLRRAGALPVIYMPQALSKDDHLALLGPFVVGHLRHIQHLLGNLNTLNRGTDPNHVGELSSRAEHFADDCVVNLQNRDERGGIVQEFKVPRFQGLQQGKYSPSSVSRTPRFPR